MNSEDDEKEEIQVMQEDISVIFFSWIVSSLQTEKVYHEKRNKGIKRIILKYPMYHYDDNGNRTVISRIMDIPVEYSYNETSLMRIEICDKEEIVEKVKGMVH